MPASRLARASVTKNGSPPVCRCSAVASSGWPVASVLEELRRQPPVIAVLEDLHWADAATLYDAPTPEAVRRVADRNKLPVDRITEVRVLDPYFYR
jgi:hypothetical protein